MRRKILTFSSDSLSILAGGLLYVWLFHPETSFPEDMRAALALLLVLMALLGAVMKIYRDPIRDNIASSLLLSAGALAASCTLTALILLLIDRSRLNLILLINLFFYSAFLMSGFRLGPLVKRRLGSKAGNNRKRKTALSAVQGIRIEELLAREPVKHDFQSIGAFVADRTVLVTGGAGSVGFELCSQLLRYNARLVVILDVNETRLLETETELRLLYQKSRFVSCVGSIQDRARLREIFDLYRPQLVFHAASYKHGPIMESNPQEALKNNVMGTLYMIEASIKHRAERFILLSADTAYCPTTITGASKRIAEMLVQRADGWSGTRFFAVRFGAAINGNGSVLQYYKKQVLSGGPIYIADKRTVRYFMTTCDVVLLILEAGAMAKGGEIFALDMGEPVNMYDLVKGLIVRMGLRPDKDVIIELTGRGLTEKIDIDVKQAVEAASETANERIMLLKETENPSLIFEAEFDKLCQSIDKRDYSSAIGKVRVLVPTFRYQKDKSPV